MYKKASLILVITCLLVMATTDDHARHHKHKEHDRHIKRQSQTPLCPVNETYASSGIDCLTCENYQNTTCPIVREQKCYCLDGYVRDSEGRCIKKSDCPSACPIHEHYVNKTPCEYVCDIDWHKGDDIPFHCNCNQTSGCVCDKGYVRCEVTKQCIPKENCYPQCEENEEPSTRFCQPYCANHTIVRPICPLLLIPCKKYCNCSDGYIRDGPKGKCIPLVECIGCTAASSSTSTTSSTEPLSTSTES